MSDHFPALVLEQVTAGYGGTPVLKGLDLTVPRGTVVALIGPNGAGKSTVARVACGLMRFSGRARVAGAAVDRARVGLAPQETALFPALSARENLAVVARLAGLGREAASASIEAALARTACSERADAPVRGLSGGWRRRVNLAAALVSSPALIVADEPTEGVDAVTRGVLGQALRDGVAEGAGCLLISHDPGFVAETADEVVVLLAGTAVRRGSPARLVEDAFGRSRLVSLRFAEAPTHALSARLHAAGLAPHGGDLDWRGLSNEPLITAAALSPMIDPAGGEISIRRPGLDEVVDRLSGRLA